LYFLDDFDLASIDEFAVSRNHVSHCPKFVFWTRQTLQCIWNPQSINFSRKSFSYNLNMSQNNSDGNGCGQANSSGYGHPNHSGYGQHLASTSGYDHQTPSGYGRRPYNQSGLYPMQTPDHPILPPLPFSTITPNAAQAYFEGGYRAWEEICRLNGILQPHQTIPHPSTMHPSLPSSRPSNPPPRQGQPPTRAPNPLNHRQNPGFRQTPPSAPSTIPPPVIGARV
jgi:hypothetical protein